MEQKLKGNANNQINLTRKTLFFKAELHSDGTYKMDLDTKGATLAQLGVLTIMHQKIGEYLFKSVKSVPSEFMAESDEGEEDEY